MILELVLKDVVTVLRLNFNHFSECLKWREQE